MYSLLRTYILKLFGIFDDLEWHFDSNAWQGLPKISSQYHGCIPYCLLSVLRLLARICNSKIRVLLYFSYLFGRVFNLLSVLNFFRGTHCKVSASETIDMFTNTMFPVRMSPISFGLFSDTVLL